MIFKGNMLYILSLAGMMSGDLALVKLVNPVTLGRDVNVICLPTSGEELPPKTPTITSGWGTTEEGLYF